ncbi:Ca2+-modulated nonselective cation channel [Lecanosticta acicola]|uniref:Ca2+-modulated nonselective cation channel n=1 Tax=Lecanosticta acicola TaxID=111012 RepID=A0AAI8YRJ5_9PEZI|nr:Ca2+-modulated nonselective cation channel [Lecanosticta acicola]
MESLSLKDELRIMIVGDSMTHASEGDFTWRYRLWEWFKNAAPKTRVTFVGPYKGTVPAEEPHPPEPPKFPDDPDPPERDIFAGGYAKDISPDFPTWHFSQSGRQIAQAKDIISNAVREHQPDMLLVMLGFNDMAWCVSGPEDTFKSVVQFVTNVKTAKPNIHLCLGNVPQRSPMDFHKELVWWTSRYNSFLHHAIPEWSTKTMRIEPVEIERSYGYVPDQCKGTFDDVHPNELGEFQIARAFSQTLHQAFGIGNAPLAIPEHIPRRPLPVPQNVQAHGVPYGIQLSFDKVYGSRGYDIRQRNKGQEEWSEFPAATNQVDNMFTSAGQKWEYQVRCRAGDRPSEKGSWSKIVSGTAQRSTAPPPSNGKVYSTPDGFEVTWDPIDEAKWQVDRYAVLWLDKKGGFLCAQGARGTTARVHGCEAGHRYDTWLQTWTALGPSVMESTGIVVVGSGVFSKPASEKKEDGRETQVDIKEVNSP